MESHVGGRLELETPQVRLLGADYRYLFVLLLVSIALHGWILARSTMTARDGIEFARYAANLGRGGVSEDGRPAWLAYIQSANHPPGYPAVVLLTTKVVKQFWDASYPEQLLFACKLASALAGILLIFPTYRLGRGLFESPFAGFAAALLFQVAPTVARTTTDGLSESLFLLFMALSLACGVRAMRRASTLWCLMCGLFSGLAYLVRPEGAMMVLAVGAAVAGQGILRRWPRDLAIGRLIALIVGLAVIALPYMLLIGKVTNKPTAKSWFEQSPIQRWKTGGTSSIPANGRLFADWYNPTEDGDQRFWMVKTIASETWKSSHYVPFVLALFGLAIFRRQVFTDPGMTAVVALGAINVSLLAVLGMRPVDPSSSFGPYISERHTLMLVLLVSLFCAGSLETLARLLSCRSWMLLAGLVATALPSATRPLHENRLGFYHAGQFLASANLGPEDVVIDPFSWSEWYAGRSLFSVPEDSQQPKTRWAILDDKPDDHHSRLPRLKDALNVKNDGANKPTIAYYWPEDGPVEKAKVLVYRQQVK